MVRGGRTPALRYRRLLTVLARLGELDLLPAHAVESLSAAYRFLRSAEHRLQEVDDRQEHMLPLDDAGRLRIAASMGYASWDAFFERLERHRRNVDEQFAQVFGEERETDAAAGGDPLGAVLAASTDEQTGTVLLEEAGFAQAGEAWSILARYRDTLALKMPDAAGHERLARLMPDLLRAVAAQGNATVTLERVMAVVESVAKRSVYLALLAERSIALSQFVQLCGASPWIARLLGRHRSCSTSCSIRARSTSRSDRRISTATSRTVSPPSTIRIGSTSWTACASRSRRTCYGWRRRTSRAGSP